jgi:hypothetical protein
MSNEPVEYSLGELIEHPVLRMQMTTEGLERRCLNLILDTSGLRHSTNARHDRPPTIGLCP